MVWLRRWLGDIRARSPLERRQAAILQVLLLVVAIALLIAGIAGALRSQSTGQGGASPNLLAALVMLGILWLVRRGWLQVAAGLTTAVLILGFGQSLAAADPAARGGYLALLLVPVVVAGLLLPRLLLVATAVVVFLVSRYAQGLPYLVLDNFFVAILFASVALDQFGGAIRTALANAVEHERALESSQAALSDRTTELQAAVASLKSEIVERRRLEAEREAVHERLLQSQRLESIGRLAGGVAHDFNNLLTAIRGYADLLSDRFARDDIAQEDLEAVRKATDQAASLTRQLLAFSRNQELRPSVVDLGDLVRGVDPLLRRLIGERVALVVQSAADLWPVLVDPSQMEAVVVNLAVNARDAMPDGGRLTIETANVELDNEYARSHAEVVPGAYAMLAVSDTGIGMDAETLGRIFEPFFTTKGLGKGTGLGLATVYGTVRQSGGHIWVYSEPGHGTTSRSICPGPTRRSRSRRAGRRSLRPAAAGDDPGRGGRGCRPRTGRRRAEAARLRGPGRANRRRGLAAIERHPSAIGLLLTDVVMPGIGGLELIDEARRRWPEIRAIVMSGYTPANLDLRVLPRNVIFLEKPFTLTRLDEVLHEVLQ